LEIKGDANFKPGLSLEKWTSSSTPFPSLIVPTWYMGSGNHLGATSSMENQANPVSCKFPNNDKTLIFSI